MCLLFSLFFFFFFFFNDTATTEIYTLSLHDALPISTYRARNKALDPLCTKMKQSGSEALDGGCGLRLQPATMRERKAAATPGRISISIPLGRTRQLDVDGLFRLIHLVIFAESLPPRRNHLNQEPPAGNLRNVADSGEVRLQIHLNLFVFA